MLDRSEAASDNSSLSSARLPEFGDDPKTRLVRLGDGIAGAGESSFLVESLKLKVSLCVNMPGKQSDPK